MTLAEARQVLRLAPDEDPSPHLADFQNAREHIASMVRTAPPGVLADRYLQGLIEFDQALDLIHQYLGIPVEPVHPSSVSDLARSPLPVQPLTNPHSHTPSPLNRERTEDSVPPQLPPADGMKKLEPKKTPNRTRSYILWFLLVFIGSGSVFWHHVKGEQKKEERHLLLITALEQKGASFIENRRWQEAAEAFAEIEKLAPGSEVAAHGQHRVESGIEEEQNQFMGYWLGQAAAELDAGRLDPAETAAHQVLNKYPANHEAKSILERVSIARIHLSRTTAMTAAKDALSARQWLEAMNLIHPILTKNPDDPEAKTLLEEARAGQDKAAADQAKARDLFKKAMSRDTGQFDQVALELLREAASLAPEDREIATLLEKFSNYTRTIRVPEDFATPAEAFLQAHDRDRVVLGSGNWQGPLVLNAAIELQGAGFAACFVECSPREASAITIGPGAKGARISGITFRHQSFAAGIDRYSAALVRGGNVTFVDCKFTEASGHGLAVIEGGQVNVSRSRFSDNGWNGIAAMGQGTTLEVKECEAVSNFEHGIESWDGAAVILVNNRCEENSRNGIHADNHSASASIEGNRLLNNREFGLVVDSAASGKITDNLASENLRGGFVIRTAAAKLAVIRNQVNLNKGPGIVLEKGLSLADYTHNACSQNSGQQFLPDADLNQPEEGGEEEENTPRARVVEEPFPAKVR